MPRPSHTPGRGPSPRPSRGGPPPDVPLHEGGPALVGVMSAWGRADVRVEVEAALEAVAGLRFHQGLRRGWPEARAEAAVREAAALARLEGVRISDDDLRVHSMEDASPAGAQTGEGRREERGAHPLDPGGALALGIWRSQWNLVGHMAPLNTRGPVTRARVAGPALVAGLHRDICSVLLPRGLVRAGAVAIPTDPAALRGALALVSSDSPDLPALVAAAALRAQFRMAEVFIPGSLALGGALERWVLVRRGVDPTGVAVISSLDDADPQEAGRALAGWAQGDDDGIAAWLIHVARSLTRGARVGEDVALRVQAGRLG